MVYAYIRVSTDKQTVENQRFEVNKFVGKHDMVVDKWVEETVSGTKAAKDRKLGKILRKMKKGDVLICTELSRLGRSLFMIMSILNRCMDKEIKVWTIKDGYRLGDDISSKVLAFAFGLSAEIERNLISQRTKEGLARRKAEGQQLGRKVGGKNSHYKLSGKEDNIRQMINNGMSKLAICRKLKCAPLTLYRQLDRMNLPDINSQKNDSDNEKV